MYFLNLFFNHKIMIFMLKKTVFILRNELHLRSLN